MMKRQWITVGLTEHWSVSELRQGYHLQDWQMMPTLPPMPIAIEEEQNDKRP